MSSPTRRRKYVGLTSKAPAPPPPPFAAASVLGGSPTSFQQVMRVLHAQELTRTNRKAPATPFQLNMMITHDFPGS
eukprot:11189957-Lingulodinium_polyedra.AAC.1